MICIYMITNTITGDFYIGQTINFTQRIKGHKRVPPPKMREDVKKYSWDAFKFEVLEECKRGELTEKELYYIKTLNPSYNILPFGYEISEETRQKRSQSLMGHEVKPETRAKIRVARLGKKHTMFSREKMKKSRQGHPVSPEVREKIRQANLGKKHNYKNREKSLICVETQVIYESEKLAAEDLKVTTSTISAVLRGRIKTVHGFHLQYTEESATKIPSTKLSENAVNKKPVVCVDTGQIFESIAEASRFFEITYASIYHVLRGESVFAGGHLFRFVDETLNDKIRIPESIKISGISIICLENEEQFSSISEASRKTGIDRRAIRKSLRTGQEVHGLHFKRTDNEDNKETDTSTVENNL